MLNGTLDFPYLYFHMLSLLQEPAIKILLVQYSLLHNHHRLVRGANDVVSSVIDLPLAHVQSHNNVVFCPLWMFQLLGIMKTSDPLTHRLPA